MAELALVNRRATLGEMSASIAHEIKQPLTAIVIHTSVGRRWLEKQTPDVGEALTTLERIANDAQRANKVVESIRGMFRNDERSLEPIDANDVIRDVLAILRVELHGHDVAVRTALSDGSSRVRGDWTQLQQVVLNLVRNATEAMATVTGRPPVLKVASAATDSEFIVTIEDNGPGIAPETIKRIFEPFFTTKSNGMGVGLSICRSIVESHGGRLSAAPAKPHGTVFEIVLPRLAP